MTSEKSQVERLEEFDVDEIGCRRCDNGGNWKIFTTRKQAEEMISEICEEAIKYGRLSDDRNATPIQKTKQGLLLERKTTDFLQKIFGEGKG